MRIISGIYKGKTIVAPKNLPVRPTTDFAKEALFNVLNNRIEIADSKVLDLFCGTGNISYEFASRGAKHIVSVDRNYNCFRFVKKTCSDLNMDQVVPLKFDVFDYIKKCKETFDIIFADPPYDLPNIKDIHQLVFESKILSDDGLLIIEHSKETDLTNLEHFLELRKYGNVNFSIFSYDI